MKRSQTIFILSFFSLISLSLVFSGLSFAVLPQDPGESQQSTKEKRGTYICKWEAKQVARYRPLDPPRYEGKCVTDSNNCKPGGYAPGNACDKVEGGFYHIRDGKVVDIEDYDDLNEETLNKRKADCQAIKATCAIAHPEFECRWINAQLNASGDVVTPARCESKTSCDSAFTPSVSCSKLSKENCESDKNIKKVCVEKTSVSTAGEETSKGKLDRGTNQEKETITLFEHKNYEGKASSNFDHDVISFTEFKVSSIRITGGTWEVCDKENYGKPCIELNENVADLKDKDFNDKISSFRKAGEATDRGKLDGEETEKGKLDGGAFQIKNPLQYDTIPEILDAIAGFLYTLALAVVTVMVLWAGFQILTAAGNPEGIDKGKRTLLWAVIGTVVILVAGGIADLTADILGGKTRSSPGPEIAGTAGCSWVKLEVGPGRCAPDLNCKSGGYTAPSTLNCRADTPAECGAIPVKNCVEK